MALSVTVHGITVKTGTQTSGRQATADITTKDGLDNVIYTVPNSAGFKFAVVAVSITNRLNDSVDTISLAVCDSDVPKPEDFIEWNTTLVASGVLERTQIMLQPGQRIVLRWGTAPAQLVPEHDDPTGVTWAAAATGTGTFDIGTPGRIQFTLGEGDTATLNTGSITVQDGATYRAAVSFYSTDITGVGSSIVLQARDINGPTFVPLITLGVAQRDLTDTYATYTFEFTVDDVAGTYTTGIDYLQVAMADVNATIDRISLIQIA